MNLTQTQAVNNCLAAPGLAIHGTSSALVKYANTFSFKVNGEIYSQTAADAPSLAGATLVAPFPNGTAPLAINLANSTSRVYTLVLTTPEGVNSPTNVVTWFAGSDFTSATISGGASPRQPLESDIPRASASNAVEVGYVTVANLTGAAFVPGTTALDSAGLTVTYLDNYAQVGA